MGVFHLEVIKIDQKNTLSERRKEEGIDISEIIVFNDDLSEKNIGSKHNKKIKLRKERIKLMIPMKE